MHVLSTRAQLAIGVALILLLAMTRGQHFASVENLPSASWSIFFLAGFYLRPRAMFALLFAEASVLDFASLASGTISDWCLSPAYWALVPAYGSLWLAGRLFAGWQRGDLRSLALLVPTLVAAAFVAYLLSGGGFYFFSGRYPEPTLAGFLPRIAEYVPRHLGNLAFYVGTALVLHVGIVSALRLNRLRQAH
ncbi:MAG: hypothetical protein OZ926_09065 [Pseudomonas sp.]|jgi:hypothetical protein|uniref:hypothetical protein n=1 Tax=Pseudomonadaceae TaxID=135621 RepID=UPI00051CD84F|nr:MULTISPECIES: hypothetical protein [Pseudomonadaceae]MDT3709189.1 hypothetical protein [Pseudomonadaceae bacterium]KGK84588.1 cobalamin ABC transporter [Stutzerimonas degradans]MCQ4234635.1 hypothetical protein [Stutzerimonas degradans]MCQ4265900.1 hypothetical protein [Stutzerimonas degradans]MEB2326992.1 hypothetical protein [Pseudomonas sp.]